MCHFKGQLAPPLQAHNLFGLISVIGKKPSLGIQLSISTDDYYNEKQLITFSVVVFWTIFQGSTLKDKFTEDYAQNVRFKILSKGHVIWSPLLGFPECGHGERKELSTTTLFAGLQNAEFIPQKFILAETVK